MCNCLFADLYDFTIIDLQYLVIYVEKTGSIKSKIFTVNYGKRTDSKQVPERKDEKYFEQKFKST